MRCKSVLTRIDALRTGELESEDHVAVEDHLAHCRSCSDSVHDVEEFAASVRSLVEAPPSSCVERVCSAVSDSFDSVTSGDMTVFVAFSDRGVRRLDLGSPNEDAFRESYRKRFGRTLKHAPLPRKIRTAVVAALEGRASELPEVDLTSVGEFERKVLETIRRIPRGEVRTYEWVARAAGNPKAVRAVGNAMAGNPVPLLLPCHRVVPTSGGIGNYAFGTPVKRRLLEAEEVPVDELERLAKQRVRFIGSKTTHIFCFPTCHNAQRIREEYRVPFHDAAEAAESGYRPCKTCVPAAA